MPREKILIIDDEEVMRESLTACLESERMVVTALENGMDVLPCLKKETFDLIILDLMLNDADGLEILRDLRFQHPCLPVIVLSAKKELHDKVLGLGLGADDYITKPFQPPELIARIKAQIRKTKNYTDKQKTKNQFLSYHNLRLDLHSLVLFKIKKQIKLNARLFKMLKYFMENPGRVVTKEQIYDNVWDDLYFDENTLKVYINKLRKLIEDDPNSPVYLHTVWGMGYKFNYEDPDKEL